jgi:hypothetical protein
MSSRKPLYPQPSRRISSAAIGGSSSRQLRIVWYEELIDVKIENALGIRFEEGGSVAVFEAAQRSECDYGLAIQLGCSPRSRMPPIKLTTVFETAGLDLNFADPNEMRPVPARLLL